MSDEYTLDQQRPDAVPARYPWMRVGVAALLVLVLGACASSGDTNSSDVGGSGDVAAGEELYAANCAQCHGIDATGTDQGPPFVHEVYVPSHHADGAFLLAVRNGVRPHHWDFGPMPPLPGVTNEQVTDIVAYVRSVQRDAGLIE
ncbi:c-type cytochrome [Euzebya rosea]|uniref:c-type cytochrome n=1 Tax=Euzebya rosea TaxID=2052804 RepID=UPI00196B36BF|nr:cytochrome c [Euzebya rosea]